MHDDDPHDDPFLDAPPDPAFVNQRAWIEAGTMRRGQPVAFTPRAADAPPAESRFLIDWVDQHRMTLYPADPVYPNGCALDVALEVAPACRVELPYPAARLGYWLITCRVCGYAIVLDTAGRADDPRSVRVPCLPTG